jgi:hypothetical protein
VAPRGDFFTFFLPTRIGEGYSHAHTHKIHKSPSKKWGPGGGLGAQIWSFFLDFFTLGLLSRWEIPEKWEKMGKNGYFLGCGWGILTLRTGGPQAYVPIERTHG